MKGYIDQMITEGVFAAGIPVQGKAQIGQKALGVAGPHLLNRFRAENGNMNRVIIKNPGPIVKLPTGMEGIRINRQNQQKQQKKTVQQAFLSLCSRKCTIHD